MSALQFQENLNQLVREFNKQKKIYLDNFSNKSLDTIDFSMFESYRKAMLRLQGDWTIHLKSIQDSMESLNIQELPIEINLVNQLLLKTLKRNKEISLEINKFKQYSA